MGESIKTKKIGKYGCRGEKTTFDVDTLTADDWGDLFSLIKPT